MFGPAGIFTVGDGPDSVAVADFNSDGILDLAVANSHGPEISVLLGIADGGFAAQNTFAKGDGAWAATVGDFNGDGAPDIAVANVFLNVWLATGLGSFKDDGNIFVGGEVLAVAAADFNGDGYADLATVFLQSQVDPGAKWDTGAVTVVRGGPDGPVTRTDIKYPVGRRPFSAVAADFDGDGRFDLAIANKEDGSVSVLLGTGGLSAFRPQLVFGAGNSPVALAVGDFNRDGRIDLAAVNLTDSTVSVLLGNGSGRFGGRKAFAVGAGAGSSLPSSIATADFDGDGNVDLAVVNNAIGTERGTVSILRGTGDGSFGSPVTFEVGGTPCWVAVGDFNRDGRPDLAVVNHEDGTVSVLLNQCGR